MAPTATTHADLVHLINLGLVDDTFTSADVDRLAADILSIAVEEPAFAAASDEALLREWLRRLGGRKNIGNYLACLRAGDRRRA